MLQLGHLHISFPVIQAALSGYSDAPMRKIARRFGAEFTLCEVMLDQFVVAVSKRKSKLYFATHEIDHPCGAQLMGSEPAQFAAAAQRLVHEGIDLIDLNFACPVRKVLGRQRGGFLMSDPDTALDIVERVRAGVPDKVPVTVKLRKGFDDSPLSHENFYRILDGAIERGIGGVTVHGRTVKQRYTGLSDWDFLKEVKTHLVQRGRSDISLIGSGDLFDAETCLQRYRESGVDGLALARGVIGNPWLFREVRAAFEGKPIPAKPPLDEQRAIIAEHLRLAVELYGESRSATTMRAFGVKYAKLHPEYETVRSAFAQAKSVADWYAIFDRYYKN